MILRSFILPFLVFIFSATHLFAQDEPKQKAFLGGILTYYNRGFLTGTYLGAPQAGFGWKNKRSNWHEADLTSFFLGKGENFQQINLGIRYQHSVMLFKDLYKFTRTKPFLAQGILLSSIYAKDFDQGKLLSRYLESYQQLFISPGIEYHFSKKLYTSVQIPVELVTFTIKDDRQNYPNHAPVASSSVKLNLFAFDRFSARICFGYKF